MQEISHTINRDSLAHAKISSNAVQGHLSKKYLMRKIIVQNILDSKYLQFTVVQTNIACL